MLEFFFAQLRNRNDKKDIAKYLTICMLHKMFMLVLSSAVFISILTFSKNVFRNEVSRGLDSDQDWCSIGFHMGPNCLKRVISRLQKLPLASYVKC